MEKQDFCALLNKVCAVSFTKSFLPCKHRPLMKTKHSFTYQSFKGTVAEVHLRLISFEKNYILHLFLQ